MYRIKSTDSWRGLSKLQEEMGELQTVLSKIIGNGGELAYWGGADLGQNLIEELADVSAALNFFIANNFPDSDIIAIGSRELEKLDKYWEWSQDATAH